MEFECETKTLEIRVSASCIFCFFSVEFSGFSLGLLNRETDNKLFLVPCLNQPSYPAGGERETGAVSWLRHCATYAEGARDLPITEVSISDVGYPIAKEQQSLRRGA